MTDNQGCQACSTLQEDAANFVENGVTTAIATRLKNDKGFSSASSVDTDCEALTLANDCLIGYMEEEIEAYDPCDWKLFTKRLLRNLYNLFGAIIPAICGIWANIWALYDAIDDLKKQIDDILSRLSSIESRTTKLERSECTNIRKIADMFQGNVTPHRMTLNTTNAEVRDDITYFYFLADILDLDVCGETAALNRLSSVMNGTAMYLKKPKSQLVAGDILATINKSEIVPTYMSEENWKLLAGMGDVFFSLIASTCMISLRTIGVTPSFDDTVMAIKVETILGDYLSTSENYTNATQFRRTAPIIGYGPMEEI